MEHQQWFVHLLGVHEGGHGEVDSRRFPESPLLGLKAKWGQRSVVGAAPGDPRGKNIRVSQQVRCHESAVGVACDGYLLSVGDTPFYHIIYCRLGAGHQLIHIGVVGLGIVFPHDGHGGIQENAVAVNQH